MKKAEDIPDKDQHVQSSCVKRAQEKNTERRPHG